ncbi:FAD-binding oxidoreductase [Micromonospora sonneratiae]|uniref:FAD-binding oxidoreductase n=1 Tax=Micromonospora sonneratiae TaxID=1184706 RepID=A0ABW3YHF5_9ACTN
MSIATEEELLALWSATTQQMDPATDEFWRIVEERRPGLLPQQDAALLFTSLGRLVTGGDDAAGRAALLAVLGRAHQRFQLMTPHHQLIGDAMTATMARYVPDLWTPEVALTWIRVYEATTQALARIARSMRPGPAWTSAEVVDVDRPAEGIGILNVRPQRRLSFRPGQAVPVSVPQHPGRWRWYAPANAPRPDDTIELHVRAVPDGSVSHVLANVVRPGQRMWLGPAYGDGLLLAPGSGDDLLLVAGGTGLAPLRSLVEQVVAEGDNGRRVTLVVGSRTFMELYDATSLDKLQSAHGWLTLVPAFSHDPTAEPEEVGDALTIALPHFRPGQDVYVCGPPAMTRGALLRLLVAGVPAERIHLPDEYDGTGHGYLPQR